MIEELKKLNLPKVFQDIWSSSVPSILCSRFDSPARMAEMLEQHPDGFSESGQLVPLWEINGHTLIGYLKSDRQFIEWFYEDGPEEYKVISDTYKGVQGYIFRSFLYSKKNDELKELAKIFELNDIESLIRFKNTNENWEDDIIKYMECSA
ncbi:hypothetical protein [Enterovibrio norvegicus]|uniref:Uncharacterized protein n=1 Tax=Enterovibrio norvegicus DSM 15893 TaxID=1121869 RepID=A0A1I5XUJ2_9GAMM|nr:hypothetical protein [Enterovibrio norvegicus]SFQ35632.1 hypothetical protein SAMN03084138_04840 [Enterovibrio norvegicus DSM 15893]